MKEWEMREYLKARYNGKYHGTLVDEMSSQQVYCVYTNVKRMEKKYAERCTCNTTTPVTGMSHIVNTDNGDYVDVESDEFFTKEEYDSMMSSTESYKCEDK